MGRISTGWKIVKQSFQVIKHDKEILIYPILAGISILLVIGILGILSILGIVGASIISPDLSYISLFFFFGAILVVSYFISTFFQAAIVTSATIRFSGKNPTLADGLRAPSKRILSLLAWGAISALVGTILSAIKRSSSNRSQGITIASEIGTSLLGTAWKLITFFVIPIILFEKQGPIQSIKRSSTLFKKTWGENVTAQFSIAAILFLIILPFILLIILAILSGSQAFIITSIILLTISIIIVNILSISVNGILRAALYHYAISGKMPHIYDNNTVKQMFTKNS
ncbi:MAG: DUF6159 family protein [Nanoarchaeota archaeon]